MTTANVLSTEQPTTDELKPGVFVYLWMRCRVAQVAEQMVMLELEELFSNNITPDPIYLWTSREKIEKKTIELPGDDPAWETKQEEA